MQAVKVIFVLSLTLAVAFGVSFNWFLDLAFELF